MSVEMEEIKTDDSLLVATFFLGEAIFGINTAIVEEVVLPGELTVVHHAPEYVAGIRNLRGRIVMVVDLKIRLDLGSVIPGSDNRILIVDWKGEPVGLLVDRIADTMTIDQSLLNPPPPNINGVQGKNLKGVYKGTDRLIAILDPDSVLDPGNLDEQSKKTGGE